MFKLKFKEIALSLVTVFITLSLSATSASACREIHQLASQTHQADIAQCQASIPYDCNGITKGLTSCLKQWSAKRTECRMAAAAKAQKGHRKAKECFAHQRRMYEEEQKRKVERVRDREELRRIREKYKNENRRRIREFIVTNGERLDTGYSYYQDLRTLFKEKGNSKAQLNSVVSMAQTTNNLNGRLSLSQDLTDIALRELNNITGGALTQFNASMSKLGEAYAQGKIDTAELRSIYNRKDDELREIQRAAANAISRQRAAANELARQRNLNYSAVQRARADARRARARQQQAQQQQNTNALINGLISGFSAYNSYNRYRPRSSSGTTRRAPTRRAPRRGRGGCTDGEYINC